MTTPVFHTLDEAFGYCRDMDASLRERLDTFSNAARALRPAMQEAVDRLVVRFHGDRRRGLARRELGRSHAELSFCRTRLASSWSLANLFACRAGRPSPSIAAIGAPIAASTPRRSPRRRTKIAAAGAQIVAIMPDRQQFAVSLKHNSKMHYPVLTDMDNGYALSLDLAIWVGAEVQELMATSGRDLPGDQGNDLLDAAAAGELRRGDAEGIVRCALHRSGLPQADGDRGSASGGAGCAGFTAHSTLVVSLLAAICRGPFPAQGLLRIRGKT